MLENKDGREQGNPADKVTADLDNEKRKQGKDELDKMLGQYENSPALKKGGEVAAKIRRAMEGKK